MCVLWGQKESFTLHSFFEIVSLVITFLFFDNLLVIMIKFVNHFVVFRLWDLEIESFSELYLFVTKCNRE